MCPRAFILALNGYTIEKNTTYFGSLVHGALASLYMERTYPRPDDVEVAVDNGWADCCGHGITSDDEEILYHKARGVLLAYAQVYKTDWTKQHTVSCEEVFDLPISPSVLARRRGMIDRKFTMKNAKTGKRDLWLMEHKTHGRVRIEKLDDLLSIKFQNVFYALTDPKIVGILHNVIRNPQSKPHKGESLDDYERRIEEDCLSRPDYYFFRWEINCTSKSERVRFIEDLDWLLSKAEEIQRNAQKDRPPANPLLCEGQEFTCDYLRACATNSMLGYIQKPLYEELTNERD